MTQDPASPSRTYDLLVEHFGHRPRENVRRLWCFPHAGAGAAEFRSWPSLTNGDTTIRAIRLPGRESRILDPPFTQMRAVCDHLAEVMGPFVRSQDLFYGQCSGAFIAYELVAELQRVNSTLPARLIVASQGPPNFQAAPVTQSSLNDHDFRQSLLECGAVPPELSANDELWELVEPILRADYAIVDDYASGRRTPRIAVPITVLVGASDRVIRPAAAEGWRDCSDSAVTIHVVEGTHFLSQSMSEATLDVMLRPRQSSVS